MNATELFHKDGRTAGVFYCEKCRMVKRTQYEAEQCCKPYKCSSCGKDCERQYYTICNECDRQREITREQERFAKAEKVTEWDGPVLYGDTYYESIEDMIETEEDELPDYVWTCTIEKFVEIDVDGILQRICENGYEDFDESSLKGIEEFEVAARKFEEANAGAVCWNPDYKKALLISPDVKKEHAAELQRQLDA